jgi:hypothetical protein
MSRSLFFAIGDGNQKDRIDYSQTISFFLSGLLESALLITFSRAGNSPKARTV